MACIWGSPARGERTHRRLCGHVGAVGEVVHQGAVALRASLDAAAGTNASSDIGDWWVVLREARWRTAAVGCSAGLLALVLACAYIVRASSWRTSGSRGVS